MTSKNPKPAPRRPLNPLHGKRVNPVKPSPPRQVPLDQAAQQQTLPPGVTRVADSPSSSSKGSPEDPSMTAPTMEQLQRANLELQMMLAALGEEKNYWMNQALSARAQLQQERPAVSPPAA